jgi:hypothetical protein
MKLNPATLRLYIKMKLSRVAWRFMPPPEPGKWVFIVGCYNSGTTLLHQLLSSHPEIGSMPNEGQFFSDVLPAGRQHGLPRLWALQPETFHMKETTSGYDIDKLIRQWAWMYDDAAKPILLEKTILHSARTRWLQQHFPESYFIALFRNGYAVAEGIRRKEKHALDKCITQWAVSNEILLDDLHYIKNKLTVSYEDLTADAVSVMKKVTDFLSISELPAHVFEKEFIIHKQEGTISNQNNKSFERLTAADISMMNSIAAPVLERLGYAVK